MIQIFRTDNPLFGRGLKFGQRICYLNAMMYFLFPVPRFVFLTAPIAYLLTSQNIIVASALMVMVYAGPHMFHTLCTQSRLDGKYRYSFCGEIYDNVLLFHIMIRRCWRSSIPRPAASTSPARAAFSRVNSTIRESCDRS